MPLHTGRWRIFEIWDGVMKESRGMETCAVCSVPCVLPGRITITVREMGRAADEDVHRSSLISFELELLEIFRVRIIRICMAPVWEKAAELTRGVTDTDLLLVFIKTGYLME